MGGFSNPPPSPPDYPGVSVPDFTSISSQVAEGLTAAGAFDDFIKRLVEHVGPGLFVVVGFLVGIIDDIFSLGLKFITALQGANTAGFYTLLSAALEDLTGVSFPATAYQLAFAQGGVNAANTAIGASFVKMLLSEMMPSGAMTPAAGLEAAECFLGYALAFGIREANVAMLVEFLPEEIRFLEGFREYGSAIARNLGLGRLTRLVMQPIMKALVQDPLTWYFNQQFTPTLLPVTSMFKAYWRGALSQADLNTFLGYMGYNATAIGQLEIDSTLIPSPAAFIDMYRTGYADAGDLASALTACGIPQSEQPEYLLSVEAGRAASHLDSIVSAYVNLIKARWISTAQASEDLQEYGLSTDEINWVLREAAPATEYVQTDLSQTEVQDAYLQGLITLDRYTTWLTRRGYSPADQAILQYELLLKQNAEAYQQQISAWKLRIQCLDAVAKGQPVPPGFDAQCNPTT